MKRKDSGLKQQQQRRQRERERGRGREKGREGCVCMCVCVCMSVHVSRERGDEQTDVKTRRDKLRSELQRPRPCLFLAGGAGDHC